MEYHEPTKRELETIFDEKYGSTSQLGWSPALRRRYSYFNPDDVYEATIDKLVTSSTEWLDVGCGRKIFPSNPRLSQRLADRAKRLVGVDPDETIEENPYIHERYKSTLEDIPSTDQFDLITLRMVAEHVEHPADFVAKLSQLMKPGGSVAVYTVFKYSPVPLITNIVPFSLHNPAKRVLWGTSPVDTFPTQFKMNTQKTLDKLFEEQKFSPKLFLRLDDCRTFSKFKLLATSELKLRQTLNKYGRQYPEYCLLAIYQKAAS